MKECSEQLERTAISEHEKILLVKVDKLQNKVFVLRNQLKKKNNHCNYLRLRLGMCIKCFFKNYLIWSQDMCWLKSVFTKS